MQRMKVYCYPVDRNSTYIPLLFDSIDGAFERIYRQDGSLEDARRDLVAGESVIVHVHWEEFVLRECRSEAEADLAVVRFEREIEAIAGCGGPIAWTVHNELPHEIPYHRQFLALRSTLAHYAHIILLHDEVSRGTLAAQIALDHSKVRVLPHPSYLGRFESEAALLAALQLPNLERRIQAFGWIRLQKGFGPMIAMLDAEYLHARRASLRISGRGVEAAAVIGEHPERLDIHWDLRHVPDCEIPQLLRTAACVILPYERVLTSGVALLALSVGALVVGVDIPLLRELLPDASRRFLYQAGDTPSLHAVLDEVFRLDFEDRRAVLEANLDVARRVRPGDISRRLAAIYGELVARDNGAAEQTR